MGRELQNIGTDVLAQESWQRVGSSMIIKTDLIAYWMKQKQCRNIFHMYRYE